MRQDFRLLIVDDDVDLISSLRDVLEQEGYPVAVAGDGEMAIRLAGQERFDLALIDVRLPDMGGLDLIEKLAEQSASTEFIVVTGYASLETAAAVVKRRSVVGYETKPIDLRRFLALVGQIEARREIEEQLKESEARYRLLFERSGDAIFLVETNTGRYVEANAAAERLTGRTVEEIRKLTTADLAPGRVRERPGGIAGDTGPVDFGEVTYVHPDGTERTALLATVPVGRELAFGIARDITERKGAEEALRESEEELRSLFETMTEGVVLIDAGGEIVKANPAAEGIAGLRRSEIEGHAYDSPDWSLQRPDGTPMPPEEFPAVRTMTENRPVRNTIVGVERPDNTVRWIDVNTVPIAGKGGNVEGVVLTFADISERKKAEEALRESEERSRALLDAMPDMMFRVREDGTIIDFEPVKGMEFYLPPEKFIGRKVSQVLPREVARQIMRHVRLALETGELQTFEYQLEEQGEMRDYEGRIVASSGSEVIAIARDVTERRRSQEQVQRSQLLASLGKMTAGIAHEVNNPLSSVLLYSELLLATRLPTRAKKDLRIIRDEARRASTMMRDLLAYSRRASPRLRRLDLSRVIARVLEMRHYPQSTQNIVVTKDIPDAPVYVRGNSSQLTQLFMNLVLNAEDAVGATRRPDGGNISVTLRAEGDRVRVTVADDGVGIPPENMEQVFYPFFTTKASGEGTGLGLSTCHGIVTDHGGMIYAENNNRGGATFTVVLPLSRPRRREG